MTIRIDPDVLDAARSRASEENRTLTNYIETVLRRDLGLMGLAAARQRHAARGGRAAAAGRSGRRGR